MISASRTLNLFKAHTTNKMQPETMLS